MNLNEIEKEQQKLREMRAELLKDQFALEKDVFEKTIVRDENGKIKEAVVYVSDSAFDEDIQSSIEKDGWILGFCHKQLDHRKLKIKITVISEREY
jgi:hypothetical protein